MQTPASNYRNVFVNRLGSETNYCTSPFPYSSSAAGEGSLTLLHLSTFYSRIITCHLPCTLEVIFCCHRELDFPWWAYLPGCRMSGASGKFLFLFFYNLLARRPIFLNCYVLLETECNTFPFCIYSTELPSG